MTSSSTFNIFLTGATGYIGGTVLDRLLKHEKAKTFTFTVLVRASEKAEKLKTLGVDAVIGSYDDTDKIEELASKADLVIAMADCDHLEAARAILRGMKRRHEATGTVAHLIHTSGTGTLHDNAAGMYASDTIYNDADPAQIETLAPTQIHRNVDLEIVAADKAGYVRTYIILPSAVYGTATGRLVDLEIQNPHSILLPALIKASAKRGQAGMFGLGKNRWPNVDIEDTADLYLVLVNSILSKPDTPHGREGYYFGENGEHSLYQVGEAIGKVLVDLGLSKSPEPTTFTEEEIGKYFRTTIIGTNSRCKAERSRSIGWKPVKTTEDMLAGIRAEAEILLKGYTPHKM